MPEGAQVSSIEAVAAFRASLIAYVSKTRPVLEDACDDVFRTRQWLEQDRRPHWENEVRRRRKVAESAEQALFSARLSNLREPTMAEQSAVTRARRALAEAEEKLRLVRKWIREFDNKVEPLVRQLEVLRTLLSNDMGKAALHLAQLLKALEDYANIAPPARSPVEAEPAADSSQAGAEAERPLS